MSIFFDISTPDSAYFFLLDIVGFSSEELIMEYRVECDSDLDLFWERNKHRIEGIDINDVHFLAFHVTGSLDECSEIKKIGIRNLQYVLSHNTMLSKLLSQNGIHFDIEKRVMFIDDKQYNVDYDYYRNYRRGTPTEKELESIAHRIYYDFCVDGFFANDRIESYGTRIHERPEFITTLINLSPKAARLDAFWTAKSTPYKVVFYATADQIHKFTFDIEKNNDPYTLSEQESIKKWMLINAVDRAFDPYGELYIYIRDDMYIPPEQIVSCERMY